MIHSKSNMTRYDEYIQLEADYKSNNYAQMIPKDVHAIDWNHQIIKSESYRFNE